jgi:hypothetical protein
MRLYQDFKIKTFAVNLGLANKKQCIKKWQPVIILIKNLKNKNKKRKRKWFMAVFLAAIQPVL